MVNIYFDFDNTLAYRKDGMWADSLYEVFLKNNISHIKKEDISKELNKGFSWHYPEKSHKELFGSKNWWEYHQGIFSEVIHNLDKTIENPETLAKKIKYEYMREDKWFLYPESRKVLEKLKEKNYKLNIITNHIPEFSQILNKLEIDRYFEKIYLSADIGYEKPNKEIFLKSLDFNSKNDINIMIGDNYQADIVGSENMGMISILVRKENIHKYNFYLKTLHELPSLIEDILTL